MPSWLEGHTREQHTAHSCSRRNEEDIVHLRVYDLLSDIRKWISRGGFPSCFEISHSRSTLRLQYSTMRLLCCLLLLALVSGEEVRSEDEKVCTMNEGHITTPEQLKACKLFGAKRKLALN